MSVIDFPSAPKRAFSDLIRNPERDRAEIVLQSFVAGMKTEGIPRGIVVRALFDHLIEQLTDAPEDAVDTPADTAEHVGILNEIDARWTNIRNALIAADPDIFKKPG